MILLVVVPKTCCKAVVGKVCDKPGQIATQIKTIADLIGKEIGVVTSGGNRDDLLNDNLRKQGLDVTRLLWPEAETSQE